MEKLRRVIYFGLAFGASFALVGALIGGGMYLWVSRTQPWNTSAISALYDRVHTEGDNNTLVFSYTVVNNTDRDWRVSANDQISIFAQLAKQDALSASGVSEWLTIEKPLFVPSKKRVQFDVHLKYSYPEKLKANASREERKEFNQKVERWVHTNLSNLTGFTLFDERNKYEIHLPGGWRKTTK